MVQLFYYENNNLRLESKKSITNRHLSYTKSQYQILMFLASSVGNKYYRRRRHQTNDNNTASNIAQNRFKFRITIGKQVHCYCLYIDVGHHKLN